jgi:MoaA/NifB/PqqE/SkfB family radical SAM enzyme
MSKISKTFCPAKWNEIMLNFTYNYVFSCCKSTPQKYSDSYIEILDEQKKNLLNGIQDPSCNYCWKSENNNLPSLRQEYLKTFDSSQIALYENNEIEPSLVELYIGNECNFQCTYCNPKYSSQWELDCNRKKYKIFTDRYFYENDLKNKESTDQIYKIILDLNTSVLLKILGGEPLINKLFWKILSITTVDNFFLSTNLSCKTKKEIDNLYKHSQKFKNFMINVSIDSTGVNAEFTRYGINFQKFEENLDYLLSKASSNTKININSVVTSITIHDLPNFFAFIQDKKIKYPKLTWSLNFCVSPRIQSFDTLPDEHKNNAIKILKEIEILDYTSGANTVISALLSAKFNNTLYNELKVFLEEFAQRKKINVPVCLK